MSAAISLTEKLQDITAHWSPRVIARLNDCHFKLAKLRGEFVWHKHDDTDEAFLVVQGELEMRYRDRIERVRAGELIVVPRGTEHCPFAAEECHVLLVELAGTVNTGDAGGPMTASSSDWI